MYMTVIIYKLFSEKCPASCYVGSTECSLKFRWKKHKDKSVEAPNRRIYKKIHESGGWQGWQIVPLETFETDNRRTRLAREQFWMDEINPDMNSVRCLG